MKCLSLTCEIGFCDLGAMRALRRAAVFVAVLAFLGDCTGMGKQESNNSCTELSTEEFPSTLRDGCSPGAPANQDDDDDDQGAGTLESSLPAVNPFLCPHLSTPLHVAAFHGRSESIQWLLEEGHDIHARNDAGATPLHAAAASASGETVIPLLVANAADVDAVNASGYTPLHICAMLGRLHGAATLLAHGANIHATHAEHATPLELATIASDTTMTTLLLGFGADPALRGRPFVSSMTMLSKPY
ncbi:Aste57867_19168 [Aphanomyces stellatus]|uniref:Aste57867_19168 protein n=1 Tax=Aphanomyces stellatus TaxID=120398 RepID=A0A485LDD9_9STRA|nr:hypothetical protein As57867_019104 [Aphanomyces stellatus]VFT95890.1 Aste57867_19168 [Aphanomyces stellatus]